MNKLPPGQYTVLPTGGTKTLTLANPSPKKVKYVVDPPPMFTDYMIGFDPGNHIADAVLYGFTKKESASTMETDEELAARIRYVAGNEATRNAKSLDELAERYGLKRRHAGWRNVYLGQFK